MARRILLVLLAAGAFGGMAAWVKGQGGDGLDIASQVRAALGNLSTPWLLVGVLAGVTCRRIRAGAMVGMGATLAALTGFYLLTGAVIDLNGQDFPLASIEWMSANRAYYAAGVISGLLCGAAGAWWRARSPELTDLPRQLVILAGVLLVAEPLALVAMGLVFPHGAVQTEHAPELVRLLASLLGSWTLSSSTPPVQSWVYTGEAAIGATLALLALLGRESRKRAAP